MLDSDDTPNTSTTNTNNNGIFHITLQNNDKYSKFYEISLNDRRASLAASTSGSVWSLHHKLISEERREYVNKQLAEYLPEKYLITNSVILVLLSGGLFLIQLIMIAENAALNEIGSGIWAALFYIVSTVIDLVLVNYRSCWLLVLVYLLHYIGFLVGLVGIVVVNLIGLNSYDCFYPYRKCYEPSAQFLHIPMIIVGAICSLMSIVILIVFKYKLKLDSRCNKFSLL